MRRSRRTADRDAVGPKDEYSVQYGSSVSGPDLEFAELVRSNNGEPLAQVYIDEQTGQIVFATDEPLRVSLEVLTWFLGEARGRWQIPDSSPGDPEGSSGASNSP
jgi:hypothetical protein